ncbi:MAG: signal peptide peptidase SppA [Myxococcota bacterium]|jgi:protease-4|nr:signal peptide peptidase SppA [Myxococcota bacterium]
MMKSLNAILFAGLFAGLSSCGWTQQSEEPKGPRAVVINIEGSIPYSDETGSLLGSLSMSQRKLEKLLETAASDLTVQEIAVHIGPNDLGLSRAAELGQAIAQAGKAGKPLSCHLDAVDNASYYMALLGCPEIVLSPAGEVEVLGLSLEAVYLKELLDSMGIKAQMLHVGKYKDAAEPLTSTGMSDDTRVAYTELLGELHSQLVATISEKRGIDRAKVQRLMDTGPHSAAAALEKKLVDRIATLGAHLDALRGKYAAGVDRDYGKAPKESLSLSSLFKAFSEQPSDEKENNEDHVGIIPVIGAISLGRPDSFLGQEQAAYDAEIVEALATAADDDAVKAVVLRIDSPGGSALASDNIWHAVRALASRKPVVASMADTAASGGYYVACAAKEIFASGTTLTGSIGVVGGKIVLTGAAEKLGARSEVVRTGERAGLGSAFAEWNSAEQAAMQELMVKTYDMFISRVAEGRGLEEGAVRAVAEGRVWTGTQALKHKLVDKLGTQADAITRAKELGGLPVGAPVRLIPEPKSFFESLGEAFSEPRDVRLELFRRSAVGRAALGFVSVLSAERVVAFSPMLFEIR